MNLHPGLTSSDDGLRRIRVDHIELQVMVRGDGTPVVLLHGFPLDHTMWNVQIAHLADGFRVIAPDLRGFGGSEVTPGTVSMEQMADDVNGLLNALGVVEPIVLCGLSMGGYVAFQFWRKYRARLRGLVLCDTRAQADSTEAFAMRFKMVEHVLRAGTEYVAEAMLPKLFAPATFVQQPAIVDFERQKILGAAPAGVVAALRGVAARSDSTKFLADIALPTLVVVGQHDAISTVDEMRTIAAGIPAAELVVIPDAGHMTPMENPTAFNAAIDRFLTRI